MIGDIHGHADKLEDLLDKLGIAKHDNYYSHPRRKILFVGDVIDRASEIRQTLEIVKQMVDNGNAIGLKGNHEYNALCFHLKKQRGHLRKHVIKNIVQHYETLKQFQNSQQVYESYLEWFKTLLLFYEIKTFRAVHACCDKTNIDYLKIQLNDNRLTDDLIYQFVQNGTKLNEEIEQTLKGKEIPMRDGLFFADKDVTQRTELRIKW